MVIKCPENGPRMPYKRDPEGVLIGFLGESCPVVISYQYATTYG
jgi:hypothetical protein